jgi:two-component system, NarL family, sensor kinase
LKSNDLLIITVATTFLVVLLCSFIIAFILRYKSRQNEYELEKQNLRLEYELESDKALLELSEQTMQVISQEIHDNVGQTLTLAKLQVNTMNPSNMQEHKEICNSLLTRAIQDLRDMSRLLVGNFVLTHGLEKSIERELALIQSGGYIQCSLTSDIGGLRLNSDFEIILFRSSQETLNNILKYAKATTIKVDMKVQNQRLILKIVDNGIGFDVDKNIKGLGLINIQNRAKILNGICAIESTLGQGTNITFDVPLQLSNENIT